MQPNSSKFKMSKAGPLLFRPLVVLCMAFIFLRIIWRVMLEDPVEFRNIQPSHCHICVHQYPQVCSAELEECHHALILLLLSMNDQDWQINVVQPFIVLFHRFTV